MPMPAARGSSAHVARGAAVYEQLDNPVKTVSETVGEFWKTYDKPPVLPMYRGFIIDFLTQIHLTVVDSRFKYNQVFALGVQTYYKGLMGNYDKLVGSAQSDKIWDALIAAVGMKGDTLTADAEAVIAYAKANPPATILKQIEGTEDATTDAQVKESLLGISSGLYNQQTSFGLFKLMEECGAEVTKTAVEEWAKALKITPSRATADLETFKLNKNKLQKAEELLREVEIREKKKLAERLEAKAKALAEQAAAKSKPAEPEKEASDKKE